MFIKKHLETCSSTNDFALDWAQRGAPHKSLVICDKQTKGRGRQGKNWFQETGSLTFSIILRPNISPRQASRTTLITAVALSKALLALNIDTLIKWPNDLLLPNRKKFAGILTEAYSSQNKLDGIIIGIGINLYRFETSPKEYGYLSDENYSGTQTDLLESLLPTLENHLDALEQVSIFEETLKYFRQHSITMGNPVSDGIAIDINPDGSLLIQDNQGNLKSIYSL